MPLSLSEFYRMVYGKNDATKHNATDVSFIPNDEFMELVWERGQIMMQGQSCKARKTPVSSNFQFHTSKVHEKESIGANASATAPTASKIGRFVGMDSVLNVPLSGASIEMGVNQDDDMVPWFNYPIDDYCSDFLPEISGVTAENDFNLIDKRDGCNQPDKDFLSHNVSLDNSVSLGQLNTSKVSSSSRTSLLFPWSLHQAQISAPSLRSGISDIGSSNSRGNDPNNVTYEDSIHGQGCSGGLNQMKMQTEDSGLPCSSSSLLNFSHFSRSAAIARSSLQNGGSVLADSGSSGLGIMGNNGKQATHNTADCRPHKEMAFLSHSPLIPGKVDSSPSASKPFDESRPVEIPDTICRKDGANNDKLGANVVLDACESKTGGPGTEKGIEPIGASSSVCSGNSAERGSNDLTKNLKRRSCEMEDSECQSEDVEQESVGIKKPTPSRGGTGSKRSRAAEVHNLSERRRRDRINEKMRALQELIPNCNKVDKASMLDEAIEYLKTLQLQVQIMSMGAGLCMSPMMFSTGMQHIHPTHVPHFSTMGVGMGIGMGYGMGMRMIDMNGGSQGHPPMIPLPPPTQGSRYPSPAISGLTNFQGIPESNVQVFGHPGQGMPISFPPPIARPPTNLSVVRMGAHEEVPNPTSSLNEKELMRNSNSVVITQALELDAANESLDQSVMVEKKDQVPDIGRSTAASPNNTPAERRLPRQIS